MNSLRSRARLSDSRSSSSSPEPLQDFARNTPNSVGHASCSSRSLAPLFLPAILLLCLVLSWDPRQLHYRLPKSPFRPEPLPTYTLELTRKTPRDAPPPIPIIYRDLLSHLSSKPEPRNQSWPPRITRIPTSDRKYILPGAIGEQESKARIHFMDMLHLARALDRVLVLPNVGQSRLGMCRDYPFDFYYKVDGLEDVISMDDFLWLSEDEDRMNAQLALTGKKPKVDLMPCTPNLHILHPPIRLDSKDDDMVFSLRQRDLVDVLIINWDLRRPIFPTSFQLQYSSTLLDLAERLAPQHPFVMVHWRMETVPSAGLVACAHALVDTIINTGITKVWLASDYPFSLKDRNGGARIAKSSTFRDFGDTHHDAMNVLASETRLEILDLASVLGKNDVDTGVLGILDKLVGIKADVFLSGAKGCGRSSSFTKQIVEGREGRWSEQKHMLNVVDRFG